MNRLLPLIFVALLGSWSACAQTEERLKVAAITTSAETGQDYSPWLNDDLTKLVASVWQDNLVYVDVILRLEKKSQITRLSLYDFEGTFPDKPAYIYALNGTSKTLLGTFDGAAYLKWVDIKVATPILAEAIVVYKHGNNIPQKIKIFGYPTAQNTTTTNPVDPVIPGLGSKIPVDAKRWYQLNNAEKGLDELFDGKTAGRVELGYGKVLNNYDAYYPLRDGEEMTLTGVRFYDGEGSNKDAPLTLSVITDRWERVPIATFTGEQYNMWVGPYPTRQSADFKLDVVIPNARYLVLNCSTGFPVEIELYGTYKAPSKPVTPAPAKSPKLKAMFGVNAFEWDFEEPNNPMTVDESKMQAVKSFAGVRHYMDWEKLELTEGAYTFSPVHSGGWNYDAIYERCKAEGIEVLACLKTLPNWMLQTYPAGERDVENVPVRYGRDFAAPTSYLEQAKVAFQFAARYGNNKNVDASLLSVNKKQRWGGDDVNQVRVGLGLINYFECENERDKWWKGRKAYQTAREYAANLSAFYDGHKKTMGAGVGVKNADPTMKVVMAGVALANTDYVRGMIDWCRQYRGYRADGSVDVCWDVINYHVYSDNGNSSQSGASGGRGAAPEVSQASQIARDFVQMAHQELGGMPVWITETGYDIHQGSPLRAIPVGNKSVLLTQADWILRTALLYARAGIDKVFFYQLYDNNPQNPVQFNSSGLINSDKTRKPAADYLYQANRLLGEYAYRETLSADPLVDRYTLNGKSAYVLSVPDEKGRTASYTLDLPNVQSVDLYTPKAGANAMTMSKMNVVNGKLQLIVTETPVFVLPESPGNTGVVTSLDDEPSADLTLQTFRIFPNPATDYLSYSLRNDLKETLELRIYDAQGRLFKDVRVPKSGGVLAGGIELATFPTGLFLLEVRQGGERIVKKFLKFH
ncbi:MAG: T9SS type A sorting domain-containing protein [Cytophagaceae bacterium]|nr:T9SS type A sorting domain-containing protein [Cytophagaceae bacterium]